MDSSGQVKGIIDGFDQDFLMIVNNFVEYSPDLKLAEFFKFWNDNFMDCIFANRFDPRELLESITEINKVLVNTLTCSSLDNSNRIVALYYLLCLYLKQPRRFRQKIRLNFDDIATIDEITKLFYNRDARFAWIQLKRMQAIDLVEERLIYGPSMLSNKYSKKVVESSETPAEDKSDVSEFLEAKIEPVIEELEQLCTPYEQLKDFLKIDGYYDSTVEMNTQGSFKGFLAQAKSLLHDYKYDEST